MKKTETFGFRINEDTKAELNSVAPEYGLTGGQLITLLVERFLNTHKGHRGRMVWPPSFVYMPKDWTSEDGAPVPENQNMMRKMLREEMMDFYPQVSAIMKVMSQKESKDLSGEEIQKMVEAETKKFQEHARQQSGNRRKKGQ
jgi:hypothetical protein